MIEEEEINEQPTPGAEPAVVAASAEDAPSVVAEAIFVEDETPAPAAGSVTAPVSASEKSEEGEEIAGPRLEELDAERAALPWYAVHTYSGFESRVKASLEERVRSAGLIRKFGNVIVPEETVVELVRGQKKTSTRKFLPGYIFVQMCLDDETWHLVNGTPKITGFVGDPRSPSPLAPHEVENLVRQMEGGAQRPKPKVHFEEGDAVKVIDGPFAEFNGTVDDVKPDKGKLRVLISIFGRNTPVELDFVQVEKV